MTNEIAIADKVLIIADEELARKANGRIGSIGYETMIIQGQMLNLPPDSTKIIVVVRSEDRSNGLPHYLSTRFAIHWPDPSADQSSRRAILDSIFDVN